MELCQGNVFLDLIGMEHFQNHVHLDLMEWNILKIMSFYIQ